jgi:hypothetical protein
MCNNWQLLTVFGFTLTHALHTLAPLAHAAALNLFVIAFFVVCTQVTTEFLLELVRCVSFMLLSTFSALL